MAQKQESDVEKLLSNLFQAGAELRVEDGFLLVGPPDLAQRFGEEIRRLKAEILLALGHCPICAGELRAEIGELQGKSGRHINCSREVGHFDKWNFSVIEGIVKER